MSIGKIRIEIIQLGTYNSENTPREIQVGEDNSKTSKNTIWKMQIGKTNGKDSSNQYISANSNRTKKQKHVGKYKSAKVSRGNTSRIITNETILGNPIVKTKVGKQQFRTYTTKNTNRETQLGKYKSEDTSQTNTHRKIQFRKIQIAKWKYKSNMPFGKYRSKKQIEYTNRKIQTRNYNSNQVRFRKY